MQKLVLETLQNQNKIDDGYIFAVQNNFDYQELVGILKSLEANLVVVAGDKFVHNILRLTDEGQDILKNGSPEFRLYTLVPPEGTTRDVLQKEHGELYNKGFKYIVNKAIKMEKNGNITRIVDFFEDRTASVVRFVAQKGEILPEDSDEYVKRRKLVAISNVRSYSILKGPQFRVNFTKPETELTSQMIIDGSWKEKVFKPYNFDSLGVPNQAGFLHPMMKVREEYRQIFIELGFQEMPSDQYVESSFWNFDSLFQPQQHPARDAHDTFFLSSPSTTLELPDDYVDIVKRTHENGGECGSIGWRYNWSIEEAKKKYFAYSHNRNIC
jgi:phenylalanyl-tRNA synthetase alpha chain